MKTDRNQFRYANRVASDVRAFREAWKRKTAQDATDKRIEHQWHKAEVYGLWAAAAVGLIAVVVSSFDSHDQREVMQRQLDEMQAEQRPNLWTVSELASPTFVPLSGSGQVIWTVHLTNYGKNFVTRGTIHDFMLLGDGGFEASFGDKDGSRIAPVAPGQGITYTVVSPPGITAERYDALLATTGGIQIKLVMDYEDLAGAHYSSTLHLSRTNAGSITYGPDSHIEQPQPSK